MKITIVGTAYPLRGGIAHYNGLLASELAKHHAVEIVTFKRQYPGLLFPGKTQEESPHGHHAPPAPQLIDSINPFNWIAVGRRLRERKPDLLIFKYWLPFFGPCFGTIARIARRKTNTKVLFICDNVIPHEHRPGDKLFTRYAFKPVDFFVVQSGAVEQDLNQFWPGARYRNVPHPIYNIFGSPISKQEAKKSLGIRSKRVLLFFGYVRAYKGLSVLLQAMAKLRRRLDVHLLVVGEFYEDPRPYLEQVQKLELGQHVSIVSDYVANERVKFYFCAADAVILPYISATQSGIAQIAYNFDKPVIATHVGGLAEVVHDNKTGYIVPPNDPEGLAERILSFYNDEKETLFVKNVRKEKGKYTWDNLVRAIEDLVQIQ